MKIDVKGAIIDSEDQWIYDWFGIEATSPKKVNDLINQAEENEELEVEVNSGGGSVFAGSEIYTALKSYKGNVTTKIVGIAASAASVAAMAGDKVLISPTGQIMIHNASGAFSGDYNAMNKGSEILQNVNKAISNAYMLKTKLKNDELLQMMNKETWLTPQEALDKGFVDEIMFTDKVQLVASVNNCMLPREVVNKMKNKLMNEFLDTQNIQIKNSDSMDNGDCACGNCNHKDNCQSSGASCCICSNCSNASQCSKPGADGCNCNQCSMAQNNCCQPGEDNCMCGNCTNTDCMKGHIDNEGDNTMNSKNKTELLKAKMALELEL